MYITYYYSAFCKVNGDSPNSQVNSYKVLLEKKNPTKYFLVNITSFYDKEHEKSLKVSLSVIRGYFQDGT